jgi:murein DD-endopeptidase MepM/ murein hydrolase activator NlpD
MDLRPTTKTARGPLGAARVATCAHWPRSRRRAKALRLLLLLLIALSVTHCETLDVMSRLYLEATPEGRDLLRRIEHYQQIAAKLKQYRDDGQLDGAEVIDVLVDAGVIAPLPGPGGRPSPVPAPGPPPEPSSDSRWAWPMKAGVISSEFGPRGDRPHEGIDIAADPGEPIYAASAGTVIYSDDRMSGYGRAVIVRHADSTTSLYAHATSLLVQEGTPVSRGDPVATVGSTGRSTGPHLHFEVRVGETPVNPREVLPRQPF